MSSRRAQQHAYRLVAGVDPEDCERLRDNIFEGLAAMGYTVRLRPEPDIEGDCSVAGSFNIGPPPTINVVKAASTGRQYFTALHEYGHRLVEADNELQDLFFDEPDFGRRLTEDVCDAVAAELLLPPEMVDRHIGERGPTARTIAELIEHSDASREACCVRAAQRLPGPGHVMIARDGIALFTASHATPYRVSRGSSQGEDHLTAKAVGRNGPVRGEASVRYASGALSDLFFAEALEIQGRFVVAVFVDGPAAWLTGPTIYNDGRSNGVEAYCPRCDEDFTTTAAPCRTCGDYRHIYRSDGSDGCGTCSCEPTKSGTRLCQGCFLLRPGAEFSTPGSDRCDECDGK